ncbi:Uncharacterized protein SCG7109_AZ_00090 [Chlamydiales bacterium SCGC AG-110-M15]|nr:Uncharacterized protein SCG7109_AZ_00090 [Chlamydiales bacterium SCGC AG-110-M15]
MICYKCKKEICPKDKPFSGLHPSCFLDWFGLANVREFNDVIARESESNLGPFNDINSSFFHGKFRKYSAHLAGVSYLLKVKQDDFPELPHCEYVCNQIAQLLGLNIPAFYLIRFMGNLDTFVSRNFMQDFSNASLVHMYHFLEEKDEFDCETLKKIIENKTQRIKDIECFIEITLFDSLIGNHDRHGRNLGLIQTPDGFHLSPVYDNPSYIGIEINDLLGAIHEPRGKIITQKTSEPKLQDYVEEWKRLGHQDLVEKWLSKVFHLQNKLLDIINSSFMSEKRKEALLKLLNRRLEEVSND